MPAAAMPRQTFVIVVEGLVRADVVRVAVPSGAVARNADDTYVTLAVRDQADLCRVLGSIIDLGFTLLSVERAESTG
jgi:hypothetical protein